MGALASGVGGGGPPVRPILLGPASPQDIADLLGDADRVTASALAGYRATSITELARALVAQGLFVEIATTAFGVQRPMTLEGDLLRMRLRPKRSSPRAVARDLFKVERDAMHDAISESEADVLHAHWTYEFAWPALDTDRPVVVTARDAPLTILAHQRDKYRAMRALMAGIVRARLRNLTAVSPYLASRWRREMLYRRDIPVIPNIVRAPHTVDVGARSGGLTILEVADNSARKNVETLLRAMRLVSQARPEARLRLVGPGLTTDSPAGRLATELGLRETIDFVGPVDFRSLSAEYARATLFVHASLEESFGNSVAEAMGHGLAVVAGEASGAIPWLTDSGRAARLVDVSSPEALAAATLDLLDSEADRRELGRRAFEQVKARFAPAVVAEQWIDLYRAARRRAPGTLKDR